jgi:hypothetical protein
MRKRAVLTTALLLGTAFSGMPMSSHGQDKKQQQTEPKSRQNLIREVRHQLVLLPYYSVFDNLAFRVEGDTVILEGQVVRPTLKSDAEGVVKNIEGIGRVVNNIEVLPPSPMDDQIRRAARFRERCRSIMCRVQRLAYGLCFWKYPFVPGELFRTNGNFARWSFHFREHVGFSSFRISTARIRF